MNRDDVYRFLIALPHDQRAHAFKEILFGLIMTCTQFESELINGQSKQHCVGCPFCQPAQLN